MARRTINIEWEGPLRIKDLKKFNSANDHGFYQIYGSHPVYGSNILLYIGQANVQTFGISIFQEGWGYHNNEYGLQVHLGRLLTDTPMEINQRHKRIEQVFKLLVYAHSPAYNATHINNVHEDEQVQNYHILNWKSHRDLLPEISGSRWASGYGINMKHYALREFLLDEKYRYCL
jgi:hypothetical protein